MGRYVRYKIYAIHEDPEEDYHLRPLNKKDAEKTMDDLLTLKYDGVTNFRKILLFDAKTHKIIREEH